MLLCVAMFSFIVTEVNAHVAAWHKGMYISYMTLISMLCDYEFSLRKAMYCLKGNVQGVDNQQTDEAVIPLYQVR